MLPIETATSRDVLEAFAPGHEEQNHSLDGAELSIGTGYLNLDCSCGSVFTVSSNIVEEHKDKDGNPAKLGDLVDRLKRLCQIGRPKRKV